MSWKRSRWNETRRKTSIALFQRTQWTEAFWDRVLCGQIFWIMHQSANESFRKDIEKNKGKDVPWKVKCQRLVVAHVHAVLFGSEKLWWTRDMFCWNWILYISQRPSRVSNLGTSRERHVIFALSERKHSTFHASDMHEDENEDWNNLCGRHRKRNRLKKDLEAITSGLPKPLRLLQAAQRHK